MRRPALAAAALVLLAAGCSQGGDEVNVNVDNDGSAAVDTPSGRHHVRRRVRAGVRSSPR